MAPVLLAAVLTSSAQPVITTAPISQTVVAGGQTTFSVVVAGTGPFSYQWQCNGTNLPNGIIAATNTSISVGGIAVDSNGNLIFDDQLNSRIRKVDYSGAQPVLKLNGASTNNAGNYAVIITDGVGNSVTSSVVHLTVSIPVYNQISAQMVSGGVMWLTFTGLPGTNYVLERTFKLAPANWLPQVTNPADGSGAVVFSNTPVASTNNFWRILSVP